MLKGEFVCFFSLITFWSTIVSNNNIVLKFNVKMLELNTDSKDISGWTSKQKPSTNPK